MNSGLKFAGIGFELAGLIAGASVLGQFLDEKYQQKGIFTVILILLAFVGWIIRLLKLLKK